MCLCLQAHPVEDEAVVGARKIYCRLDFSTLFLVTYRHTAAIAIAIATDNDE